MVEFFAKIMPFIAPLLLFLLAGIAIGLPKDQYLKNQSLSEIFAVVGIISALLCGIFVLQFGLIQTEIFLWKGLGLSLRLDPLSVSIFIMISILGFVVLRFSRNYMDGDPRKHIFIARLAITIASVELLVLSGNLFQILLFWSITSICLHFLLTFYRTRPQAIAAARKKFIVARLADVSLLIAILLIYKTFGTGQLESIFNQLENSAIWNNSLNWASIFLVITAVLKSAQFPTHAWLIEVVEAPTPVSAMLHAGLLNAGPFLMARMSYLIVDSTTASILLIIIGGFTAMFGSIVYLTQPSIKVSLGYSSIAHMGFSLLTCGFGVYSAAMLHVVAHSFYKAHAFLSSGGAVDAIRARKVQTPGRSGNILKILLSITFSVGIYGLLCYLWGINLSEDFNLFATGSIIVMGLSLFLTTAFDSKSHFKSIFKSTLFAFIVGLSFFVFEHGASVILASEIPINYIPQNFIKIAIISTLSIFGLVILIQIFSYKFKNSRIAFVLGVHFRNGLYVNVFFNRLIGSLKPQSFKWINLSVAEEQPKEVSKDYLKTQELQFKKE